MTTGRRQPRVPISLQVAYRTAGAFLVSYSINLSKGGIFLETTQPLPIGERVQLTLDVPTVGGLELAGVVAWVRTDSHDGMPDGMGIQFDELDERYGAMIDQMVKSFVGLTVLLVAASSERLSLLRRYTRSIIACEIVEAVDAQSAEVALGSEPDLAIVDLDLARETGLGVIRAVKAQGGAGSAPIPVILLAGDPAVREEGRGAGADEALATPPSFHALQAAVISALSRPSVVL